jgi:hypothetical protein
MIWELLPGMKKIFSGDDQVTGMLLGTMFVRGSVLAGSRDI